MVHPRATEVQVLRIDQPHYEALKKKAHAHSERKLQDARHEAGHVVLSYALRIAPIEMVDIRPKARLTGNLYEQVKRRLATSISFIGGTTSPLVSEANAQRADTRHILGEACLGFGGMAASRGDAIGLEGDLGKIRSRIESLVVSTRPSIPFASKAAQEKEQTVVRLCDRLKSLAHEIIADPVVAARHEELTKRLLEKGQLSQEDLEAVVEPTTLPDHSYRLEEIRKEFHLPEQCGTGPSASTGSRGSWIVSPPIGSLTSMFGVHDSGEDDGPK